MKKYLLIIIIAASSLNATAQSYTLSPSATVTATALCNQFNAFYIYQQNISGGTLNLGWNSIVNNMPTDWTVNFCDNHTCYSGPNFPASGVFDPVNAAGQGYVDLQVMNSTPGAGTFSVYVYDIDNPVYGDTLTWIITSDCPTGIADQAASNGISVFPNPVTDYLNVNLNHSSITNQLFIYNAFGQVLYEQTVAGTSEQRIDVSHYPAGIYMLVIKDENGKQTTRSFVK